MVEHDDRFAARHTASHLASVGLAELIANDADGYVELTHSLAMDLPRLAEMRRGLRARMAASPVCDGQGFARDLETAYRTIWHQWCQQQVAPR